MAILTSILGSDLISTSPSVLNGNFQNVNLGLAQSSVIGSILSQKVQISSVAGSVFSLVTAANDRVVVWAKGTITGSATSGSVALIYSGTTKDASTIKQAAAGDQTTYSLMYAETPGAGTANVVVSIIANGDFVINEPRIITQVITNYNT